MKIIVANLPKAERTNLSQRKRQVVQNYKKYKEEYHRYSNLADGAKMNMEKMETILRQIENDYDFVP
jgi:hypothetical protein